MTSSRSWGSAARGGDPPRPRGEGRRGARAPRDSGALLVEYRGVYRVGHRAPSVQATYLAAVKACGGRRAPLRTGGRPPVPPHQGPSAACPEVTAPTQAARPPASRRKKTVLDGSRGRHDLARGPGHTVPRTLVDSPPPSATMSWPARATRPVSSTTPRPPRSRRCSRVGHNSPGAWKLRRVLRGDVRVTLSTLEQRFLALLERQGLPLPKPTGPPAPRRVDCRGPSAG